MVRTLNLTIPSNLNLKDFDLKMLLAVKLYEEAKLSAGQAAAMTGLSKRTFIELVGQYGGTIIGSTKSDLYHDIANA